MPKPIEIPLNLQGFKFRQAAQRTEADTGKRVRKKPHTLVQAATYTGGKPFDVFRYLISQGRELQAIAMVAETGAACNVRATITKADWSPPKDEDDVGHVALELELTAGHDCAGLETFVKTRFAMAEADESFVTATFQPWQGQFDWPEDQGPESEPEVDEKDLLG